MLKQSPENLVETAIKNTLPPIRTSFVGRQQILEEIQSALKKARLVSLIGPGGCGKTRLAHTVAVGVEDSFADGIGWIELAKITDPLFVPQTLMRVLRITEQPSPTLSDTILEKLSRCEMLVVLDNCEHLLPVCAELVDWLLRAPHVKVLVTSRELLGVEGEVRYRVPSLTLPKPEQLFAEVVQSEAVQLFAERARSVHFEFALTPEHADSVARICRLLDGLPLAIELASARVNLLSLQQLEQRLIDGLDILVAPTRGKARHHTLRATFEWSYQLLAEPERLLLQRLSVFAAEFTLEMAETACGWGDLASYDFLELLRSIVDKSLITADTLRAPVARYCLLATIRQYAGEQLDLSGASSQTYDYYLSCYLEFAEAFAPKLTESDQHLGLQALDNEHDNFQVALRWAFNGQRTEEGLRLAIALYQLWDARGYVREGFTWFERLLQVSPEGATQLPLALQVNALTFASFLAMFLNDQKACDLWSSEAVRLCEVAGEAAQPLLGFALAGVISAARLAGDGETALTLLAQSRALERESGNPDSRTIGMTLFVSGSIETVLGHYDAAHNHLGDALELAARADDSYRRALILNSLGDLARCEGQVVRARAFYDKSLAHFKESGANRDVPNIECSLGYVYLLQGDTERAHELFRRSLEELRRRDAHPGILRGLRGFATLAAVLGFAETSICLRGFANGNSKLGSLESSDKADELDARSLTSHVNDLLLEAEQVAALNQGSGMTLVEAVTLALSLPRASHVTKGKRQVHDLTRREREVLTLIAKGLTNAEIASHLNRSKRTVEKHIANILSKLALTNRAQMVRWTFDQRDTGIDEAINHTNRLK